MAIKAIGFSLAIFLFLFPAGISANVGSLSITPELRFHRLGPDQGLTSQELTAVARDSKGFVWVASYAGLFRFDGYRFKQFTHDPYDPNSLSGNRLRSITIDKNDRVWVGTESNGVTMYDPSTGLFRRFGNDPQNTANYFAGQTLYIEEMPDGSMVFMIFGDGIVQLMPDLKTIRRYRHEPSNPKSLSSNLCLAADIDPTGQLWVACLGGSLQRFDAETGLFTHYDEVTGQPTNVPLDHVTVLMFDKAGHLWMGTDGLGIIRQEIDSDILQHLKPNQAPLALTMDFITRIIEDENGNIWVGYRDAGIDVIDWENKTTKRIQHASGRSSSLSSNNTFGIMQDAEGLIWVPTWGAGLNVANPQNTQVKLYESAPSAPGVFSSNTNINLLHDFGDDRLMLSSRDKLPSIFRREGDKLTLEKTVQLTPGKNQAFWIMDAIEDQNGNIWLPTVGQGLYIYDPEADQSQMVPGTEGWNLVSIFEDSSGIIWVSEFSRGIYNINSETLALQNVSEILEGTLSANLGPALDIIESADKALWIGTRNGVFRLAPGQRRLQRISAIGQESGEDRMRSARALAFDRLGRLWVAGETISYTNEPFASEPNFIFPLDDTQYSSLSANTVIGDGAGRMWFTTPDGLFGFEPDTGVGTLFDDTMNAPVNSPDSGTQKTKTGELVFAGLRRLTIVSPSIFDRRNVIKAPEITRLVIGGNEKPPLTVLDATDEDNPNGLPTITIRPEDRDFTVEYASLSPLVAASYTYAHWLEGFDRDWIQTDATRRAATYTNLPPGTYILHLLARDRNGKSNLGPNQIQIVVQPSLYQTLWFQLLLGALVCLVLYALYQARLAVLKTNQRKLEQQVNDRTEKIDRQKSELVSRNAQIEQTMAELKETQNKLIQSEKLAALGGLVAGVAHEINTPIGLVVSGASQMKNETDKIKEKLDEEKITKKDLSRFLELNDELGRLTLNNAQKAAGMIKSFRLVSADQASQNVTSIELIEYLQDIIVSIKPLLAKKGHAAIVTGDKSIRVTINAGALSQVITNLVSNAATHAFTDDTPGTIEINVHQTGENILISVADNGRGIAKADRSKIFDPFFTTRRGQGNTGLGLHIVHNLVVGALGGTIELGPQNGGGTVFLISFPAS